VYDTLRVYTPDNVDDQGVPRGLFANKGIQIKNNTPNVQLFLLNKEGGSKDQKIFTKLLTDLDKTLYDLCKGHKKIPLTSKYVQKSLVFAHVGVDSETNEEVVSDLKCFYGNVGYMKEYTQQEGDKIITKPAKITACIRDDVKYKNLLKKYKKDFMNEKMLSEEIPSNETKKALERFEEEYELIKREMINKANKESRLTMQTLDNYLYSDSNQFRFAFIDGVIEFYSIYLSGTTFSTQRRILSGHMMYRDNKDTRDAPPTKRKRKLYVENDNKTNDTEDIEKLPEDLEGVPMTVM
jgi:hypothetical protein